MSLIVANNANLWGKASKPFITEWTVPDNTTVTLPHLSGYNYSYFVDWGDGTPRKYVSAYNDPNASHTYAVAGTYEVKIVGTCESFWVNNGAMKSYITKLTEFGHVGIKTLNFYGCSNLTGTIPEDSSGLNKLTSITYGFRDTGISGSIPEYFLYFSSNLQYAGGLFLYSDISGAIPSTFLVNCTELVSIDSMFRYSFISGPLPQTFLNTCTKLKSIAAFVANTSISGPIPSTFLDFCIDLESAYGAFWGTNISGPIPLTFLNNCVKLLNAERLFFLCNDLTGPIPATFLDYSPLLVNIAYTFYGCVLLSGEAKDYWNNPQFTSYAGCYALDTQLTNYSLIPATWK